jgi:hypothetical protein
MIINEIMNLLSTKYASSIYNESTTKIYVDNYLSTLTYLDTKNISYNIKIDYDTSHNISIISNNKYTYFVFTSEKKLVERYHKIYSLRNKKISDKFNYISIEHTLIIDKTYTIW